MEIIKHTSGRAIGRVSVLHTISTMDVNETWETNQEDVKLTNAQVCCSKYGAATGKRFWVSSPKEANGQIIIKRIA